MPTRLLHQGLYDVRDLPVRLRRASACARMIYLLRRRAPGQAEARLCRDDRRRRARLEAAGALHPLGRALVDLALHRPAHDRRRGIRMSVIRHMVVRGRVQGVGYRAFVEHEALRRGLEGWVRNRRDGAVEAVFAGEPEAVDAADRSLPARPARRPRRCARSARRHATRISGCGGPAKYSRCCRRVLGCRRTTSSNSRRSTMSTSAIDTGMPRSARLVTP